MKMGQEHGIQVDTTENADNFNEENLKQYQAVIFLSTTGDVLNNEQQNHFQRYIEAGGGFLGIHAAADTEYAWPWYGKLVGAWFDNHPTPDNVQKGVWYVADKSNPASNFLPDRWERDDEFYAFKNISPDIHVILKIDEKTYRGGTNGDNHPMAWYQNFDGGRSFYTAGGHTDASYTEPLFVRHLWEGLNYVIGGENPKALDYSKTILKKMPEENRFTKVVLDEKLEEPMELTVLPDNRVLFIERRGNIKLFTPTTGKSKVIAKIPVSTKYTDAAGKVSEAEDGLLGLTKDPQFTKNNWIYLYYSPEGKEAKNVLARYELKGDQLLLNSKKVLLEVATQREQCCHTGGSITFDGSGNLFLSTGDNSSPRADGFSPIDERPGRSPWDAQKSSGNTNDLRGKVLRIHPQADGTYTIPEGNLFPKGENRTRPEIYTMGHRNPFRISVDPKNGYLYWGEVGPDANEPSPTRGPEGYDEFGQAKAAGNFGWPYLVADNKAYVDYSYADSKSGNNFDPNNLINNSPNNTGLSKLPPAQKAFIWYPYAESKEFPLLGSGGRTAMAGPVYHSDDFKNAKRAFPEYYDGKLLIYEWMRGWIMSVTLDKDGNYSSMEPFISSKKYSNPMDMEFGPDGDLYMIEYGTGWFQGNDDSRLVRIEYNAGNRKPQILASSDKNAGALPLTVQFNADKTTDPDLDALKYSWKISGAGQPVITDEVPNPKITLKKAGIYKAQLVVTDIKGATSSKTFQIMAGNEPPTLAFNITPGNRTFFYPNKPINYSVSVSDKEDGSLANGKIKASQVAVTADYLAEGYDKIAIAQGHRSADESVQFGSGKVLIAKNDCNACHKVNTKSIGPAFTQISLKYKEDKSAPNRLVKKVINGGAGVWGDIPMSAHPKLSPEDASQMVNYIISITRKSLAKNTLPVKGSIYAKLPDGDKGTGVYLLRAAYTDRGANGLPGITSEKTFTLRNSKVSAAAYDALNSGQPYKAPGIGTIILASNGGHLALKKIDLTGIKQVVIATMAPKELANAAGGSIELRSGSPTGKIIGLSSPIVQSEKMVPISATIPINDVSGLHDLYFMFKNNEVPAGRLVYILLNFEFKNE